MLLYQVIVGYVRKKTEKYQNLKRELKRLWSLKKVEVAPVVVGALGCISKSFSRWMDTLGTKLNVGMVQSCWEQIEYSGKS